MDSYKQDDSEMSIVSKDTKEYFEKTINEAINNGATGEQIRLLFATNVLTKRVGYPYALFDSLWKLLAKDVLQRERERANCPRLILTEQSEKMIPWMEISGFISDLEFYLKINHGMTKADAVMLSDDVKEIIEFFLEVSMNCGVPGVELRKIFADFVQKKVIKDPVQVWNYTWKMLTKDVLRNQRIKSENLSLWMTEDQEKSVAWMEIEKLIKVNEIDGANIANA